MRECALRTLQSNESCICWKLQPGQRKAARATCRFARDPREKKIFDQAQRQSWSHSWRVSPRNQVFNGSRAVLSLRLHTVVHLFEIRRYLGVNRKGSRTLNKHPRSGPTCFLVRPRRSASSHWEWYQGVSVFAQERALLNRIRSALSEPACRSPTSLPSST